MEQTEEQIEKYYLLNHKTMKIEEVEYPVTAMAKIFGGAFRLLKKDALPGKIDSKSPVFFKTVEEVKRYLRHVIEISIENDHKIITGHQVEIEHINSRLGFLERLSRET